MLEHLPFYVAIIVLAVLLFGAAQLLVKLVDIIASGDWGQFADHKEREKQIDVLGKAVSKKRKKPSKDDIFDDSPQPLPKPPYNPSKQD